MDESYINKSSPGPSSKPLTTSTKRKRITLSCTNCQKRKVKCDKTRPCSMCRMRDEVSLCEYLDPAESGESSQPYLVPSDLDQLLRRMRELEDQVHRLAMQTKVISRAGSMAENDQTNSWTPVSRSQITVHDSTGISVSTTPAGAGNLKAAPMENVFRKIDYLSHHYNEPGFPAPTQTAFPFYPDPESLDKLKPTPTGTWPDILISPPTAPRSARWSRAMAENLAVIPSDEIVVKLVNRYFTDVNEVLWHHLHHGIFLQELQQFLAIRQAGDVSLVDPAWLAILIAVLSVGCRTIIEMDVICGFPGPYSLEREIAEPLSLRLGEAFDSMILCAGFMAKPQIRLLQAFLVMVHISYMDDEVQMFCGVKTEALDAMWHDAAISICKRLRLHLLGSEYEFNLPPDPALSPTAPLYSRQLCSRIVHTLAFRDLLKGCTAIDAHGGDYQIFHFPEGSVSTPMPQNYRDDDLWPETGVEILPQPPFVLTDMSLSFHLKKMAGFWKTVSVLLSNPSTVGPGTILQIDKQITQEDNDLLGIRQGNDITFREEIIMEMLHSGYQKRRLKLHRHFLVRSYEDKTWIYSQAAALTAARSIVRCHRAVADREKLRVPMSMWLLTHAHHVSAAVILFIHGCIVVKSRQDIRKELQQSLDLFDRTQSRPGTKFHGVITHARRLLHFLCETLESSPPRADEMEDFLSNIHRRLAGEPALAHGGPPTIVPGVEEVQDSTAARFLEATTVMKPVDWSVIGSLDITTMSNCDITTEMPWNSEDWDAVFRDSLFAAGF